MQTKQYYMNNTLSEKAFLILLSKTDFIFNGDIVKAEFDNRLSTLEASKNYLTEEVIFELWEGEKQMKLSDLQEDILIKQMDACYTRNKFDWEQQNQEEIKDNLRCDARDNRTKEKSLNN